MVVLRHCHFPVICVLKALFLSLPPFAAKVFFLGQIVRHVMIGEETSRQVDFFVSIRMVHLRLLTFHHLSNVVHDVCTLPR